MVHLRHMLVFFFLYLFCFAINFEMQQNGKKIKTHIHQNRDVSKNGLTAMIAAPNLSGCVKEYVLLNNQPEDGEGVISESCESRDRHPNHCPCSQLQAANSRNLCRIIQISQSSPKPVAYIQLNNLITRQVN